MTAPVMLVPLKCTRCATPVPAEPGEIAWRCAQCGQGLLLDETLGLQPLEIHFVAGIAPAGRGRPFWVVDGDVMMERDTYTVFRKKTEDALRFWGQRHRFFVPAFTGDLDELLTVGVSLLRHPPALQPGEPVDFMPVTLAVDDVSALAEFVVVAIEAERQDKVKAIDFSLQLGEPALWILP
jgi:hypothetical protein